MIMDKKEPDSKQNKNLVNLPSTDLFKKHNVGKEDLDNYAAIKAKKSSSNKLVFVVILSALIIGFCVFAGLAIGLNKIKIIEKNHYIPAYPGGGTVRKFLQFGTDNFKLQSTKLSGPSVALFIPLGDSQTASPGELSNYHYFRGFFNFSLVTSTTDGGDDTNCTGSVEINQTEVNKIISPFVTLPEEYNNASNIAKIGFVSKIQNLVNTKTSKTLSDDYQLGLFIYHGVFPIDSPTATPGNFLCVYIYCTDFISSVSKIIPITNHGFQMTFWSEKE